MSNYSLRGKCKEMSENAVENNPNLRLVRGWYDCPIWGEQQHWWTVDESGVIHDPTKTQFPSGGIKEFYREYDGIVECSECGKEIAEEKAEFEASYAFCSTRCHGLFIGVYF